MSKISSEGLKAPGPSDGLNVNFCKNPKCGNFGTPETANRGRRSNGESARPGDYSIVAAGRGKPLLKCLLCGETLPMRSNVGIQTEVSRLMGYSRSPPQTESACTRMSVESTKRQAPCNSTGTLRPPLRVVAIRCSKGTCGSSRYGSESQSSAHLAFSA